MRTPDFNNLLKVLNRSRPDRPTLFEFYLNARLSEKIVNDDSLSGSWHYGVFNKIMVRSFEKGGYDYVTCLGSDFKFPILGEEKTGSRGDFSAFKPLQNNDDFKAFPWPDPDSFDDSRLEDRNKLLPEGMKIIVFAPESVYRSLVKLMGYEGLCIALYDNFGLVQRIADAVGERLLRYFKNAIKYEKVGAVIINEDWGFNTQTFLAPDIMRKIIFPWHKRMVRAIHDANKPAILHSCGNLEAIMNDIIDDIGYDAKHSFEDSILPVEKVYKKYGKRIAILGGMDMDFLTRSTPDDIKKRSSEMLHLTSSQGGYALGSGNSIPDDIPIENYFSMTSAALS